jgi:hypothetical protein
LEETPKMILLQENLFDSCEFEKSELDIKSIGHCDIGTISELQFMVEAAQSGFVVFTPIGHSQKADVIIWKKPNKPITIQVKKAVHKKGFSWQVSTSSKKSSSQFNPKITNSLYTNYIIGDFDILAAHIVEQNCWALYRLEDICGKSGISWNGTPKNNFELLEHIK